MCSNFKLVPFAFRPMADALLAPTAWEVADSIYHYFLLGLSNRQIAETTHTSRRRIHDVIISRNEGQQVPHT
jgi:hypothetical protein